MKTVCFDVDGTLVDNLRLPESALNWYSGMTHADGRRYVMPDAIEKPNIVAKLIEHFEMGHRIIVWSWGGEMWAQMVVRALGLEHMVDMCGYKGWWNMGPSLLVRMGLPAELPYPDIAYDDNDNHIGAPVMPHQELVLVGYQPQLHRPQWAHDLDRPTYGPDWVPMQYPS